MTRQFTAAPAVRKNVPLLLALIGPSGGGKSMSALRIATGIQRAQPGEIYVIDTEADRALQYADKFRFQHLPFGAPFGSLDYLAALQCCESQGARTVIVDSMSHEHEGPGGMLDSAQQYIERKVARLSEEEADRKRKSLKMSSFIQPKADRARLIQGILQMRMNLILCFRAKEKIKPVPGKDPLILGWQPIAGDEFAYEMTARALLLPGANGVPSWDMSKLEIGEKLMARRPEQFENILGNGKQLSEDMGEAMARWAAGASASPKAGDIAAVLTAIDKAADEMALTKLQPGIGLRTWTTDEAIKIAEAVASKKSLFSPKDPAEDFQR